MSGLAAVRAILARHPDLFAVRRTVPRLGESVAFDLADLHDVDRAAFEALFPPFHELYAATVPERLRDSATVLRSGLDDDADGRLCLVALVTAEGFTSFVAVTVTPVGRDRCALFLENAGVHPGRRGRGAFSATWNAALERGVRHARAQGRDPLALVFEVEPPDPAVDDPVRNLAVLEQARLLGGGVVAARAEGRFRPLPWAQPGAVGGEEVHALLLFVPVEGGVTRPVRGPVPCDAGDVARIADAVMDQYGAVAGLDAGQVAAIRVRVRQFLADNPDLVLVPAREGFRLPA